MTIKIDKVQTEELIYEYISELREKRRKKLKENSIAMEETWKKGEAGELNKGEAFALISRIAGDFESFNQMDKKLYSLSVTSRNPKHRRLAPAIWEEIEENEDAIADLEDALERIQEMPEN